MNCRTHRRAAVLVVALTTLLVITLIAGTIIRTLLLSHRQNRQHQNELQAEWLADAALSRARAQLVRQPEYTGERWFAEVIADSVSNPINESGEAQIRVLRIASRPDEVEIVVTAHFPQDSIRRVTAHREHTFTSFAYRHGASGTHSENIP